MRNSPTALGYSVFKRVYNDLEHVARPAPIKSPLFGGDGGSTDQLRKTQKVFELKHGTQQ
jgi:hypothetical protein